MWLAGLEFGTFPATYDAPNAIAEPNYPSVECTYLVRLSASLAAADVITQSSALRQDLGTNTLRPHSPQPVTQRQVPVGQVSGEHTAQASCHMNCLDLTFESSARGTPGLLQTCASTQQIPTQSNDGTWFVQAANRLEFTSSSRTSACISSQLSDFGLHFIEQPRCEHSNYFTQFSSNLF